MKSTLIFISKMILVVLVYFLVVNLTGALIIPLFGIDITSYEMPDSFSNFRGMLTTAIIQMGILVMLARRLSGSKVKRGLLLALFYFCINYLLNTIESLVYMRNIYPVAFQLANLLSGAILAIILGYLITALWKKPEDSTQGKVIWSKRMVLPWAGWILLWFALYWTAGALIPMNVEGVYAFYFSEGGSMDLSLVPVGYLMQIVRGSIWIALALGIHVFLKGSPFEKALITGLSFGCLMSSDLLIPNFLMPDIVRLAHLPEILFANLLWGILISRLTKIYVKHNKRRL